MPYNLSMIIFKSGTPAIAADVNTNFNALNTGTMSSLSADGGALTSDGSGNLTCLKVSFDSGKITTDGSGNITAVSIITAQAGISAPGGSLNVGAASSARINFVIGSTVICHVDASGFHTP